MPVKKTAVDYAYNYLNRYPKTEKELQQQLYKKHYGEKETEIAINHMKKKGLIDDENFCRLYIQSEAVKKGRPTFVVKGKLKQKGVDTDIINRLIAEVEDEIEKGISRKIIKEMEKLKNRGENGFDIVQKLGRRGYSMGQINKAIKLRDGE